MFRFLGPLTLLFLSSLPALAGDVAKTYDFELDAWHEIGESDGPVTLHRVRVDRKEGRWTKSTIARPHNQENLETLLLQVEYTNESSRKWKARVEARWLDEEGVLIDGFTANETLDKKSARDIVQFSVSTLKYGVDRAKTLEVEVHFVP